ncbi:MAG: lipopolysaccharide transport periplasmic protein LptA, partial [Gammaproteobacteria bacterium]
MSRDKLFSIIFAVLVLLTGNAWALSTDKDQPVSIEADSVDIDEAKEIAIYRGNVILIQGSINLNAEKVVVYNFQSDNSHIVATGEQVKFSQRPDNSEELIKGRANKAEYGINSTKLELTGKA